MATSGSTSFALNRNQLVTYALQLAGVTGAEEAVDPYDLTLGTAFLNMMVKTWEADGCTLWAKEEAILYTSQGQQVYQIGNGAHATQVSVETTLTTTVTTGASSIVVGSVTGMTVGDNIGIILTTGNTQWTTITTINTGTLTLGLTTTLTSGATAGTSIYTYTTALTRPYDITQVRYRTGSNPYYDRYMEHKAREDYFMQPDKASESVATMWYYDVQLTYGQLFIWPTVLQETDRITFTFIRALQDIINSGDNPDMPQEFLMPLVYNLAVYIAPVYGKEDKAGKLMPMAKELYRIAKGFNIDSAPTFFAPQRDFDQGGQRLGK